MAVRMIYTQYSRRHDKTGLHAASNASAPAYREKDFPTFDEMSTINTEGIGPDEKPTFTNRSSSSIDSLTSNTPIVAVPIAVFPQYLTTSTTTLTIREDGFPSFPDSFTVANGSSTMFTIHRDRPSFHRRQVITNAKTQDPIMTISRNVGKLPRSFTFVDPNDNTILDLQGNFFVPNTGAKSSAFLLNTETGEKVELCMKGSYRNRHATITNRETGEVLVTMKSNIFELRNVVGGRRTYTATIRAGLDMAVVVGLIVALDARAQ